jgi:dTDP-D-glucose 4,6-dehydratase
MPDPDSDTDQTTLQFHQTMFQDVYGDVTSDRNYSIKRDKVKLSQHLSSSKSLARSLV